MIHKRLCACLALIGLVGAAHAAQSDVGTSPVLPAPQPSLGPEPRSLQLQSLDAKHPVEIPASSAQPQNLIDDITALKKAVERVRAAQTGNLSGNTAIGAATHMQDGSPTPFTMAKHIADGQPHPSAKLGDQLVVQRFLDGTAEVSANFDHERLELVLQELALLTGRPLDDSQLTGGHRPVSLHLKDVTAETALDRLTGQLGLAWSEGASQRTILVYDLASQPMPAVQLEQLTEQALFAACRDRQTATAAHASYLLAFRDLRDHRFVDAMRRFSTVVEDYASSKDPSMRIWGTRAIRGIGDAMMGLSQYQDARGIYTDYIGRADEHDPDLPAVYLDAARAGQALGQSRQDPLAFDQAIDTLHNLLERFADVPTAQAQVSLARLLIGEMLFSAARYREAETQLKLFAKASAGRVGDQISFWLAECAFELGRFDEAQPAFTKLYRSWRQGKIDPQVPQSVYATAALRIGQCYEQRSQPKFVNALFAFLRAREDFPKSQIDAELLISVARCYGELQRDDDTVNTLWELLKDDGISDPQKRQVWLADAISKLNSHLGDYPGPVRARVLFYIAQADYRRALRDRATRASAADDAVHHYERVLAENPPFALKHAACLGLARAALLGGQDERGMQQLKELIVDSTVSARDRDYAQQLLGDYYHDKGQLRDAIKAYRGEVGR